MLADAEGLLTCYGVGEESTGQLTHVVIELCFTSSVRFLQPGLLLQACLRHQKYHFRNLNKPQVPVLEFLTRSFESDYSCIPRCSLL